MDYGACDLVEDIARDMYEKIFPTNRIGIYTRMMKLEKIVYKQLWGIRSIGIWGMPGIGKTTLAEAAFDEFSGDYEASCIIKDFDKEFLAKGLYHLWNEYLGENINNSFIKSGQKRLLIVLDNVLKPLDADAFLNGFDWFGPGSLIIITSRDKQVLVQCGVNQIYEVEGLNEDEAKQLLHGCAFGIDWRKQSGLETLARYYISVIKHFSGNPLALSLYGEMLSHMKPDKMEVKLLKLNHPPPPQIMEVFKSNYNALNDNEKSMFLDIACFFRGEKADYVMQLFEGCGFFPHVGIYVLVDKCLVTIVERKMEMHNLIQIVGKAISNEGTVELDRHVRLWDTSIIQPLLEDEETKLKGESKGTTRDIEVIFLDMSNLKFFVKPDAFKSMHNLRFLKIYSSNPGKHQRIRFREALQSLPNELRLLHWEDYPLQSLPQHFDPTHLVELNMPYSKLQKLWGGTKNLEMLKMVRLSHSQDLVEIEELIKSKNIEVIDLQGCTKIQSFPATRHLQHLRVINLSGCVEIKSTQLEEFQGFPRNLKELYLSGTGIREVTSSISHLSSLEVLDLSNCKRLQNLPMGKGNLASLIKLMLSGCSKLQNIQDLPTNLKELYLAGTSIREVPSSICHLTQLVVFDAENCKKLQDLPMGMGNLISLTMLILSGCSELRSIPDLPRNLRHLNLAETPIKKLPSSFEDLTKLVSLDLNHCERFQHLQMESFESVVRVDLSGCLELKYILGFSLQDITQLHEDGTDKVMLHGTPPCNVTLILEKWRTRHVTPMEKSGSKFYLKLMPFVTTPYRSKLHSSLVFRMYAMVSLFLSKAYLLDIHIPQEICNLLSLKTLDLSGNNFGKLPESIKQFRNLESLILCHCKNLESLPELPQSLEFLNAHGCVCLKNIHRSFQQFPRHCTFSNCFEISPDIVREILEARVAQMVIDHTLQKLIEAPAFSFSVPAFRGPNYIFHLNRGSSVMIRLTPRIETLLGFQISVVVAFWNDSYSDAGFGISHMFVFYDVSMHPCVVDGNDFNILDDVVHFELLPVSRENKILDDCCTVTECGVYAITENVDQTNLDFRGPSFALLPPYKKRKRSFSGSEDIEMENQRLNISKTKQGDLPEKISQADTAYLTSPSLLQRRSHQVFLSFSEDVPRYFVSYLIKKLKWIGITVVYSGFMGGKSMSRPEVTQAIEESSISVVILSKDYVSSSKCLDELVEIIRWREENLGNRVMPIYYEMGTSDVMKQAKTIGNRLVETYLGKVVEKPELRWMRALAYIVNIVGESSQYWVDRAKMIEKTVVDVSNQMNILESNEAGLLFIYQEEENMENFKRNVYDEMNGVRIIPIWHVYAFLLIYLFLLILKSRFILRDVIHK
ncbi:Winged helix DNA-binding domain superfamily [Arabidopsis thaliana x Arabidopsis arenosa]|uniref:Winged helix DNA-binding domain superfamily n=1 Tax=Arabidopsis thaliana x Arabidopsis arenosa TaxID=1240361 RepID=A0A8T2FLX9_9BRAS|nr:Winged helix DNA-binding domain superfamily [Arabidopsis thaliana x Arabidopsis arenosa]